MWTTCTALSSTTAFSENVTSVGESAATSTLPRHPVEALGRDVDLVAAWRDVARLEGRLADKCPIDEDVGACDVAHDTQQRRRGRRGAARAPAWRTARASVPVRAFGGAVTGSTGAAAGGAASTGAAAAAGAGVGSAGAGRPGGHPPDEAGQHRAAEHDPAVGRGGAARHSDCLRGSWRSSPRGPPRRAGCRAGTRRRPARARPGSKMPSTFDWCRIFSSAMRASARLRTSAISAFCSSVTASRTSPASASFWRRRSMASS